MNQNTLIVRARRARFYRLGLNARGNPPLKKPRPELAGLTGRNYHTSYMRLQRANDRKSWLPTLACLILLAITHPAQAMDRFAALSMIESGNCDTCTGAAGEVSRYQITPVVWHQYTSQPIGTATNPVTALNVAQAIMLARLSRSQPSTLNPQLFYLLWHRPARVDHPLPAERERAERFANLVNGGGAMSNSDQPRGTCWRCGRDLSEGQVECPTGTGCNKSIPVEEGADHESGQMQIHPDFKQLEDPQANTQFALAIERFTQGILDAFIRSGLSPFCKYARLYPPEKEGE